MIAMRPGIRRLVLLATGILAVAPASACMFAESDTPSASENEHADIVVPGNRSQLALCVATGDAAQDASARDLVAASLGRVSDDHEEWGDAVGDRAKVDAGCPEGHRDVPRDAISLSGGVLADGSFLGQRVDQPSPHFVHVYVSEGVPGGYERAPLEVQCTAQDSHVCPEVTVALFIEPAVANDAARLDDALEYALGFGDARNPGSLPPAGSLDKPARTAD